MNYRNTRLYKRSLELVGVSHQIIAELPTGYGFLADQLRRASASVVLNLAEGCGKPSLAERRRFFGIARGSGYEVGAILDVAASLGAIEHERAARALDLCDHVCAMLTRFAQSLNRRP